MNIDDLKDYGFVDVGHTRNKLYVNGDAKIVVGEDFFGYEPTHRQLDFIEIFFRLDTSRGYPVTIKFMKWDTKRMTIAQFVEDINNQVRYLQDTELYSEKVAKAFTFSLKKVEESNG